MRTKTFVLALGCLLVVTSICYLSIQRTPPEYLDFNDYKPSHVTKQPFPKPPSTNSSSALQLPEEQCPNVGERQDCGYLGITQDECVARNCCWNPKDTGASWCFYKKVQQYTCAAEVTQQQDCGWIGIKESECRQRNCCWNPNNDSSLAKYCFYKRPVCNGYRVVNSVSSVRGFTANLKLNEPGCQLYGNDVKELTVQVTYETKQRLHIKIIDRQQQRYEVPENAIPRPSIDFKEKDYEYRFSFTENPFTFAVLRADTKEVVFNSSVPGLDSLIFQEKYLELSTQLPSNANIYGLGEYVGPLKRDPKATRQTIWARDAATPVNENVYGSHPFYMEMRAGKSHGVFLLNSNGMDVSLTSRQLTYKVIGGVLDYYIFMGPTPADVVKQYTEVIGRPSAIPYWALGFHQCRWGYRTLEAVNEVVEQYKKHKIPLETMWTDIDYMDKYKDFTFDPQSFPVKGVQEFVRNLHRNHQHYVLIIDPGIKIEPGYKSFDEGVSRDIFLKSATGNYSIGWVWPGLTYFPDWFNPEAEEWWYDEMNEFLAVVPADGIWIDMNEVASWCAGDCDPATDTSAHINFSEKIQKAQHDTQHQYNINNAGNSLPLDFHTAPMDAIHKNGLLEYDVHNLFGHMESIVTRNALLRINPEKRPFILSRSTFSGTGKHAGHWTGDNWSNWDQLRYSIPGVLNFQMFGIPFVGADICGFMGNTTEELCLRWMQLGAFYPFARNHNAHDTIAQEPYLWPAVTDASQKALNIRYSLLPYFYTLFHFASFDGSTVWRPLFFEFADDPNVLDIDEQFMIGKGLLVAPVLKSKQTELKSYFPAGKWYDFHKYGLVADSAKGDYQTLNVSIDDIPMFVLGGQILVMQYPSLTTHESRQNDYFLMIALDKDGFSEGELYIDDGESLHVTSSSLIRYKVLKTRLSAEGSFDYNSGNYLSKVIIMGVKNSIQFIKVNGNALEQRLWHIEATSKAVVIDGIHLSMEKEFQIEWE
ncbi:hypothetical protein K7432_011651 [Basidiobolus ranarum]|uniref:alpha-glucosidase n=1 Tax=Basidiobolus ranarum TaxID=34480 RepID=A0ABR2WM27_9FUNG